MAASNASVGVRTQSPSYQAHQILHPALVVAPLIAGADKFFNFLLNWNQYRSPLVTGYCSVALRDLGLALGAFALARLATEFDTRS